MRNAALSHAKLANLNRGGKISFEVQVRIIYSNCNWLYHYFYFLFIYLIKIFILVWTQLGHEFKGGIYTQ